MNFLKVFLAFLFLGGLLLLKTDATEASRWGPNCSSAPADHQICPSGNIPAYATTCIDSVNIVGGVVQYGLTPAIGNVTVTVKAAAAQLVCSSVQCLRREDTQTITLAPNNGESNPAPYEIDTLGCSGGNCDDRLIMSIVSIDKGRYTSCTPLDTATGQLDENGQTISPSPLHIRCTTPAPTNTPTPTRTPADEWSPCAPLGDVNSSGSINQEDVDEYNNYIAGRPPIRNFYESAEFADTNGDGRFDYIDRNNIVQFIAGLISTFPACALASPTSSPTSPPPSPIPTSAPTPMPTNIPSAAPSNTPAPTVPPAPTNIPSSAPSNTPVPTVPPTPTNIPPPTTTPTPEFNPAACKCDSIEYTALFSGQPTTITSYGKVEGADTSKAIVRDQSFFLAEGDETIARIIGRSGPIGSVVVSSTPEKVRFQSKWTFTLPQLKPSATYRIWSQVNCQPKLQAINYTPARKTVLGASMPTQPKSFIDRMIEFLNNLFGGPKAATTTSTPTPTFEPDIGTGMILEEPTPTGKKSLQLEPIYPLEVYQKSCSFIKFRSGQFGQ